MDAFEFLETLPTQTLERLYKDPWACQAVFQALPALAQQFVMRLLACESSISIHVLEQWMHPLVTNETNNDRSTRQMPSSFHHALQKLTRLHIFIINPKDSTLYQLHSVFQQQLRYALGHLGGSPWEQGRLQLPPEPEKTSSISPSNLEHYARTRWDTVLHFMVGSTAVADPPSTVVDILLRTNLMHQHPETKLLHITDKGYEFMLQDIYVQIWMFMLEYIRTLETTALVSQEEILQFLFQLSYCQVNTYYAVKDLTSTQQLLLTDLTTFGLLYRQKLNSDRFYTTSLAVYLIFGKVPKPMYSQSLIPSSSSPCLQVIVETNFKIYAYTQSTLHIAMLSVFIDIVARLPNMVIGFITRESLRSALIHGISAQQIYDFLMKHAHSRMLENTPVIPENIADQLYLWERERNRLVFQEAWLFDGFLSKEEYEQVFAYAQEMKCVEWYDSIHFKLSIASRGIDLVRHFIQQNAKPLQE